MRLESQFTSYAYSYPHKSAYRPLVPRVGLDEAWADQDTSALFLYLHIPFCEFRCGFCNLFTLAQPAEDLTGQYLHSLRTQAEVVRTQLSDANFARLAIGGGTPTFLNACEIEQLLDIVATTMGVNGTNLPCGVEASPGTVDSTKLTLLRQFGFDRISLGVQSFESDDLKALGRPQRESDVHQAIELIRQFDFPTMNLDLIYGAEGQTTQSWMQSVRCAAQFLPEEIYLYPLYVRRLTGLGKVGRIELDPDERDAWDRQRTELYRAAREYLLGLGYRQVSMRMFAWPTTDDSDAPHYCCQSDGMIGLGCGARSYTDSLHYSYEYAVEASGVRRILGDYLARDRDSFSSIEFGYRLDREDQLRRYLILSLLQCAGMHRRDYFDRFGSDALDDFPMLEELLQKGMIEIDRDRMQLTELGLEWSDWIGPWLNSARVNELIG